MEGMQASCRQQASIVLEKPGEIWRWTRRQRSCIVFQNGMTFEEDIDLARRVAAGEKEAWDTFLSRFMGLIAGYAKRNVSDDKAVQEDFAQGFLLKLHHKNSLGTYQGLAPLRSWIFAALHHYRADHFKSRKTIGSMKSMGPSGVYIYYLRSAAPEKPCNDEHEKLPDIVMIHDIAAAIENLSISDRVTLKVDMLRHLDIVLTDGEVRFIGASCGMDEARTRGALQRITGSSRERDLASLLGLEEAAMSQRISRARKKLKEALGLHSSRNGRKMSRDVEPDRLANVRKP